MAKKKSTASKVENRSVRSNMNVLIGLCSSIAVILAIVIFIVNLILHYFGGSNGGTIMGVLNLIKDIALGIAVCLAAYYYARNKKKWFRITVFVCIIIYLIMAIVFGAVSLI